jgi:filamentous hemagglutinin family protein
LEIFKKIAFATILGATFTPVIGAGVTSAALPVGGQVTAGSATISQNGNTLNINQSSQRAVINWSSFNVGAGSTVNFNQPNANSATLNRVVSADKSIINGVVNAPGQVAIVNAAGVVIGRGGEINAGAVIASTMNISDKDFMDGKSTYRGDGTGKIINEGTISTNAKDGYIALLAPEIQNNGYLIAKVGAGSIALASGKQVTLHISGDRLISVKVDESAINTLIENKRLVKVEGGLVIIAAGAASHLIGSVIKNTGRISASSVQNNGGVIELVAGSVIQAGQISANGKGANSNGGKITLQGDDITLADGSQTNARGTANGGLINVGTTKVTYTQNADGSRSDVKAEGLAKTTTVQAGAVVDVSSTNKGNGGDINIWSSVKTIVAGTFKSQGGINGGNGGFVETSSSGILEILKSTVVDVTAKLGKAGHWLLDPEEMTISASTATAISSALATSNVTIEVKGDLTIAAGASITGNANLTLNATGTITNAGTINTGATGSLVTNSTELTLVAGSTTSANQITATAQAVRVNGALTSSGGSTGSINVTGGAITVAGRVSSNGSSTSNGTTTTNTATTRTRDEELAAQAPTAPTSNANTTAAQTTAKAQAAQAGVAVAATLASNNVIANAAKVSTPTVIATNPSNGATTINPAVNVINLTAPTAAVLNTNITNAATAAGQGTTTVINVASQANGAPSAPLASLTFTAQTPAQVAATQATASAAPNTAGGTITMTASNSITATNTAAITANAAPATVDQPAISSAGGTINISAPQVITQANSVLQANGNNGPGGNFNLQATQLSIAGSVQANGNTGGTITAVATSSNIQSGSLIQANGNNGPGGVITLQTVNNQVINNAQLQANGSGNGGNIQINTTSGDINLQSAIIQTNGSNGRGGQITTASNNGSTYFSGALETTGATQGGSVLITANNITLASNSSIAATGNTGGGTVLIGGDWQGSNGIYQATTVTMNPGSTLDASALINGDGGKVVLWSDIKNTNSLTEVHGSIYAKGGSIGGRGGNIETSGRLLQINQVSGSVLASNGANGLWLLDPYDISITSGGSTTTTSTSTIDVASIASLLRTGNVTIATSGSGSISLDAALNVSLTNAAVLKLLAHSDINVNAPITATGNALSLILNSNYGGGSNSHVNIYKAITTNGGSITIGGGISGAATGYAISSDSDAAVHVGYSPTIANAWSASSSNVGMLLTGGGDVVIRGKSNGSNTSGILIDGPIWAGNGSISLDGYLTNGSGSAVTLQIASRSGYSIYPVSGVDALLYSTKASGTAVSITGTVDVPYSLVGTQSYAVKSLWRSGDFQGISAYPVGYAIKSTGTGATVLIQGLEALNNVGGAQLQVPVDVYVAGTYKLVTKAGIAEASVDGSTVHSIGLSSYSGNVGFANGAHGNPKTIIQTDLSQASSSQLSFDYYSTGDLSIYGYSSPDSLQASITIGSNAGNVYLPYAVDNLRVTGGAVTLDNLKVNNNLQVIADTIQIGSTGIGRARTVATTSSGGNVVSYQTWTQTANAYLKASSWIKDNQSAVWTAYVDSPGINVVNLVLASPTIDLFAGRFFNSYVNPNNGWHGHNLSTVAVAAGAQTVKISNSSALTIGALSTTAIDSTISNTLSGTVTGISASNYVIVETKTGNLTVDAPITSSGTGGSSLIQTISTTTFNSANTTYTARISTAAAGNGYVNYPVVLNAGANETSAYSTANIKITSQGSISAQKALLFSGGVSASNTEIGNVTVPTGNFRYGSGVTMLQTSGALVDRTAFSSGINLIFRESPIITIAANAANIAAVYGDTFTATWTVSGLLNGDTATRSLTESNGVTTGSSWTSINLPGGTSDTNTSHINNVTFTSGNGIVRVLANGDLLLRTGSSTSWTATPCSDCRSTYNLSTSANVKVGTYTINPMINDGTKTDLGYTVAVQSKTLTITPRPISVTYSTADKVYDGSNTATTTASIAAAGSGTGIISSRGGYSAYSDSVSLGAITSTFSSMGGSNQAADVYIVGGTTLGNGAITGGTVTAKNITVSTQTIAGNDASNYEISIVGPTPTAKITPKTLSTSIGAVTREYASGDSSATISSVTIGGVIGTESVAYGGSLIGAFNSDAIATGKTVTLALGVGSYSATNAKLSNYQLPSSVTNTESSITAITAVIEYLTPVTVRGLNTAVSSRYDTMSWAAFYANLQLNKCSSGYQCAVSTSNTGLVTTNALVSSNFNVYYTLQTTYANNGTNTINQPYMTTSTLPNLYIWETPTGGGAGRLSPTYSINRSNIAVTVNSPLTVTLDAYNTLGIQTITKTYDGTAAFQVTQAVPNGTYTAWTSGNTGSYALNASGLSIAVAGTTAGSYSNVIQNPNSVSATTPSSITKVAGVLTYSSAGSSATIADFNVLFAYNTASKPKVLIDPILLTVTATKPYDNLDNLSGATWSVAGFIAADAAKTIQVQSATSLSAISTSVGNVTLNGLTLRYTRPNCNNSCSTYNNYRWPDGTSIYNPFGADPVTSSSSINGIGLIITPRPLTVTPVSTTKTYGNNDPTFTYSYGSLASGDTASIFSGALSRAAGETVSGGPYALTLGTLSAGSNYSLTLASGRTLSITPRDVTVTATKTYDGSNAFNPADFVFANGLSSEALSVSAGSVNASSANVGSYALGSADFSGLSYRVVGGNASTANYTFVNGSTLAITPATLTVTADVVRKVYGSSDPTLTYTSSGFKGSDSLSLFGSTSLSRLSGENAGLYNVTQGSLSAGSNYNINFVGGTNAFEILRAPLTVTANALSKSYGAADPSLTYTASGLVGGDAISGALSRAAGTNAGSYAINQNTLTAGANYDLTYVPARFTILPIELSLTGTKSFDGSPLLTQSNMLLSSTGNSEAVSLTAAEARTSSAVAGLYNNVNIDNYSYNFNNGALALNYALPRVANLRITPVNQNTSSSALIAPGGGGGGGFGVLAIYRAPSPLIVAMSPATAKTSPAVNPQIASPIVFPFKNISLVRSVNGIPSLVESSQSAPRSLTALSADSLNGGSIISGAPSKISLALSAGTSTTSSVGLSILAPGDKGPETDNIKLTSLEDGKGNVPVAAVRELRNNANLNGIDVVSNKRVEVNAVTKTDQSLPEGLGFDVKSTTFKSNNPDPKVFPLEVKLQLKVDGKVVSEKVMTLLK